MCPVLDLPILCQEPQPEECGCGRLAEETQPIHIFKIYIYVPQALGHCLHPSSLLSNKAGFERAHQRLFWAVGVIPEEVVLAEKDALLWVSPLKLRFHSC